MSSFSIEVQDHGVRSALQALEARVNNLAPVLRIIGEGIMERTKHRFDTSTDPAGQPWKANSAATLAMLAARIGTSKGNRRKNGGLTARGQKSLSNKKPLIGETKQLKSQFHYEIIGNNLTVGTTSVTQAYAAIQQFGGKSGRGHKVTIPARPFIPVHQDGSLYPREQAEILKVINAYLLAGLT